jgi:hypothetical protein
MRRCRKGAHWSTGGGGEVVRWRQRAAATQVAQEQGRVTESSKERGEGAACSRVGCSPFIGAGEHQGGGGRVVTVGVMALIAIDGGAGLRLGIRGGGR